MSKGGKLDKQRQNKREKKIQSGLMYTIGCFFSLLDVIDCFGSATSTFAHTPACLFLSLSLSLSFKNTVCENAVWGERKSFAEQGANDVWRRRRNEKLYNVLQREYKTRWMCMGEFATSKEHFRLSRKTNVFKKREVEPRGLAKNESFYNLLLGNSHMIYFYYMDLLQCMDVT